LLDFTANGAVVTWLPLFLFVILFGLSMDYHVFILSRVREGYDRGMPTEEAVSHGIRATAGVVTSAAAVMVGVFSIFATLSSIDFKEMGVGLALAVLIDATIVRAVLLPATMKLLGDWNWYLPGWLEWLPRVTPEEGPRIAAPTGEPAGLTIDVEQEDARVTLVARGELTLETASLLREALADHEHGAATVVLDLRDVAFLDSSGLGELLGAHQRARRQGRRLVLARRADSQVAQVLDISGLDTTIETVEDPRAGVPQA
jgi:RND superfamily putative drug exporter